MSIYSTIELTPSEAIKLIAEHICADANEPQMLEKWGEHTQTDNDLLAMILFRLTDGNKYSPFHQNNYTVTERPNRDSGLDRFKEDNYIS